MLQLRAFAQQDGFFLSLLWIASFFSLIYLPETALSSVLMLATPFFVVWRTNKFRDYALSGKISFRRALLYVFQSFFNASILFALAQILYFTFLDNGMFMSMVNNSVSTLTPVYKAYGVDTKQLTEVTQMLSSLTSIEFSFIIFLQNVVIGLLLAFPIALVCRRNNLKNNNTQNGHINSSTSI